MNCLSQSEDRHGIYPYGCVEKCAPDLMNVNLDNYLHRITKRLGNVGQQSDVVVEIDPGLGRLNTFSPRKNWGKTYEFKEVRIWNHSLTTSDATTHVETVSGIFLEWCCPEMENIALFKIAKTLTDSTPMHRASAT